MKYIDAEQLSEKIESIGLYVQKSADYNDGRNDMKTMVLDLIDSLQQEQPEVDLEKEIVSICEAYGITKHLDAELGQLDIRDIARHFAKWGMEHKKQPIIDENELEEVAYYYAKEHFIAGADLSIEKAFIAGAKWGAEHLKTK